MLREANETKQMDEGSQPAEQGGGSHHSEDGGPLSTGSMVQWMREQPPLTEEQLQNVFITSNDFSVSVSMYIKCKLCGCHAATLYCHPVRIGCPVHNCRAGRTWPFKISSRLLGGPRVSAALCKA